MDDTWPPDEGIGGFSKTELSRRALYAYDDVQELRDILWSEGDRDRSEIAEALDRALDEIEEARNLLKKLADE